MFLMLRAFVEMAQPAGPVITKAFRYSDGMHEGRAYRQPGPAASILQAGLQWRPLVQGSGPPTTRQGEIR
jgi:hypothetical protein